MLEDTVLVAGAVRTAAALVVEAQAAAPTAALGVVEARVAVPTAVEAPVHPAAVLGGAVAAIVDELICRTTHAIPLKRSFVATLYPANDNSQCTV